MAKNMVIVDVNGKMRLTSECAAEIRNRVFRLGGRGRIEIYGRGFSFLNCEFIAISEPGIEVTPLPIIVGLSGELTFEGCRLDGKGTRMLVESVDGMRIKDSELIAGHSLGGPVIAMANPASACGLNCDGCSFVGCTTVGEVLVGSAGEINMRNCRFEACNVQGDLIRFNRSNGSGRFVNCSFKDCAAAFHLLSGGDTLMGPGKVCLCQNCHAVDSIFSLPDDSCFTGNFVIAGETAQFR